MDLKLSLNPETLDAAVEAWRWKIGGPVTVLLVTLFGDIFYTLPSGRVLWLNTGSGSVEEVASSESAFRKLLNTEASELWLLPQLVQSLHAAGKIPAANQCYTLITPPVFAEGKYEVENIKVVPALEHFRYTSDIHRQIADLPDGAQVRFSVVNEPNS